MANSYGAATGLSGNANSLANNSFASLGTIDFGSAPPDECLVEVSLQASAASSGSKQAAIYVRSSLDGSNFSVAPSSTDAINARLVGVLSLPDTTARRSISMPLSLLFGGALPQKVEVYVKNECGVALASTGQVGQYRTESFG